MPAFAAKPAFRTTPANPRTAPQTATDQKTQNGNSGRRPGLIGNTKRSELPSPMPTGVGHCQASVKKQMTKNVVVKSIETDDGLRCVDIFRRNNLSFGFEEYRRDPEDRRGWQVAGGYGEQSFDTQDQAVDGAIACVPWLREACLEPRS